VHLIATESHGKDDIKMIAGAALAAISHLNPGLVSDQTIANEFAPAVLFVSV
jgi:hypothetical protein